jgi:hypothetical protein
MSDPKLPPLDDDVEALVVRSAGIDPAPPGARARVLERVEASIGPPGGGGGTASAKSAAPMVARPASLLARRLLPLAASFAIGSGMTAAAMRQGHPQAATADASPPFCVERPAAALAPSQAAASGPAPEVPPPVRVVQIVSAPVPPPTPEDQLTAERRLLDIARRALEAEDPARALQAAAQHERRFPSGVLAQEREAMGIRALVMQGRAEDARARADRFAARFPDSLLWPTIQAALRSRTP